LDFHSSYSKFKLEEIAIVLSSIHIGPGLKFVISGRLLEYSLVLWYWYWIFFLHI